jgi:monofunctional biosynthetic peptidoglycan transglycosylase
LRQRLAPMLEGRRGRVIRLAGLVLLGFMALPYVLTLVYVFVNPPISFYMLRQAVAGYGAEWRWRDIDRISPNLVAQVVISEDSRFCEHWGVDWGALAEAIDDAGDGNRPRGACTITMQSA